jgi:uncharacterized protein
MLESTFIHIPGIGQTTEQRLWATGIRTWRDALDRVDKPLHFSPERWQVVQETLADSSRSLAALDHRYFAGLLAARDHWRAFPDFRHSVAYIDIETTGCAGWDKVTVIGLYDGTRTRQYVAGDNMDEFPDDIARFALLVTFNGATFDLPFIRRHFDGLEFDQLHVDLRYPLAHLGHKGGLKFIERKLGIHRESAVAGLDGWDAVRLWNEYRRGNEDSLATLLEYNRADIENLAILMDLAYTQLWQRLATGQDTPDSAL